ncbi:MAG: flagellar filament capping protein FliD [Gemmatimonadota bacterium]
MATTTNIAGIGSGIQWGDIVDSIVKADEARIITPITAELDLRAKQREAWLKLQTMVETLNDSARNVRKTGFSGFTATVPPSPITSRTLLTATPSLTATAGKYRVEVVQLADTAKIGGSSVANTSAALGFTGDFSVNGVSFAVTAADSLDALRTRINDANTGATPTGVTATIVSEGGTAGRLVLTRDTGGSSGITITDGTGGIAREIGLLDSRTKLASSSTLAAAAAMGVAVSPAPASINVGGKIITLDLSTESIASIAAKINAAGGSANVETQPFGDETRYRLIVNGNVSAVAGDSGSQAVIDALGFTAGGFGAVSQTVASGAFSDAGDAVATAGTLLTGLKLDGALAGLAVGDAINIRGMRGDGTAVTIGLVIDPGDTMQTLLDKINDATTGFGSGTRPASASIGPDGRIRLTDSQGGASRLSLQFGIARSDGTTGTLGTPAVSVAGRSRELQQGRDAIIRVDGQEYTRSTNNITDAISGVTLSLTAAEAGTTIDLVIDRDSKGAVDAVTKFKDAYNAIRTFFDEQRVVGAPLYANTLLRGMVDSFTAALRTEVPGNSTYSRLAQTGLALDRNGKLTMDADKLRTAFSAKPLEIEALFGFAGIGSAFVAATDRATQYGNGTISNQTQSLDSATRRLKARQVDAQRRLDDRREQLVAQFTRMESAMSRITAQGSSLTSQLKALQGSN